MEHHHDNLPVLDREQLMAACDGQAELLESFVSLFREEYPGWLDVLRQAVEKGDAEGLEKAAHNIKGALKNFHALSATAVAFRLEQSGNKRNLAGVRQEFANLEQEIEILDSELTKLASSCDGEQS